MARLVLGSVESGDQTCVTSINLGQKSPEQINKLQICVAGMLHSVMSHDHESQSLINTKQSDNRQPASQNRFTPEWPVSTCLSPVSCGLMVPCEPCGQELELRR